MALVSWFVNYRKKMYNYSPITGTIHLSFGLISHFNVEFSSFLPGTGQHVNSGPVTKQGALIRGCKWISLLIFLGICFWGIRISFDFVPGEPLQQGTTSKSPFNIIASIYKTHLFGGKYWMVQGTFRTDLACHSNIMWIDLNWPKYLDLIQRHPTTFNTEKWCLSCQWRRQLGKKPKYSQQECDLCHSGC